ncbi:MAG: hypothetical protein ACRC2T_04730, partial [Thermoguttaceae bacterium]
VCRFTAVGLPYCCYKTAPVGRLNLRNDCNVNADRDEAAGRLMWCSVLRLVVLHKSELILGDLHGLGRIIAVKIVSLFQLR